MAIMDHHGLSLSVSTYAAIYHEVTLLQICFVFYMNEAKPKNLNGVHTHDTDKLDEELRQEDIEMIAPQRRN